MNPATNAQRAQLAQPNITPMYPGIHQADEAEGFTLRVKHTWGSR